MSPTSIPTMHDEPGRAAERVAEVVERLLKEPRPNDRSDRRDEQRQPFFRPVTVIDAGDNAISAFALDISRQGIRFVHSRPLEPGPVTLVIHSYLGDCVQMLMEIEWCEIQPWGRGWYMCGGRFLGLGPPTE